jgi:hypothetical protein
MRVFSLILILLSGLFYNLTAQNLKCKELAFLYTTTPPVLDGILDDGVWKQCKPANDFLQWEPQWNVPPTHQTEAKVCYTNQGIYVGVMMFDTAPDSILQEVGMRDNTVNADHIAIEFDPYNTMQDSYYFQVTASGVQTESRRTDGYYNAVWKSCVKILKNGWSVEMFIPFSAFTFPSKDLQEWRVQFYRNVRRYREVDEYSLEDKTKDNDIQFWAISDSLKNIKPPLRLFITPYVNGLMQKEAGETTWSQTLNGGLDLKWGVTQSHTLDITLLPDFSQVKSDNKVKNLSAFETVYSDYRPFFYESMSLFETGDLIYTRRIGGMPRSYYNVANGLDSNEHIAENPQTTQLINAMKFYGRSANGLAVGFFNAITDKALAYVDDDAGNRRSIETQPLTNYNIIVFNKALKGKSNVFFSNANTFRGKSQDNANVMALGGSWYFHEGAYKIYMLGGMSNKFMGTDLNSKYAPDGYKYDFTFAKVNGKFQYQASAWIKDQHYDPNDLGVNFINNEVSTYYMVTYREPNAFWKVLNMYHTLGWSYATRLTTGMPTTNYLNYSFSTVTRDHISYWGGLGWRPDPVYDYYEPRNGQYWKAPRYFTGNANFSTDYRNTFALDATYQATWVYDYQGINNYLYLSPLARLGNHLNLRYTVWYQSNSGQRGFATGNYSDTSIFGKRWVQTVENSLQIKYVVKNNLALSFVSRYYWSKGNYFEFYRLKDDGTLSEALIENVGNHDFTYSAFNFDFSFNWDFAPGSSLIVTYKNELVNQLENADKDYMQYLRYSFDNPFSNVLALKILYFIDAGSKIHRRFAQSNH